MGYTSQENGPRSRNAVTETSPVGRGLRWLPALVWAEDLEMQPIDKRF